MDIPSPAVHATVDERDKRPEQETTGLTTLKVATWNIHSCVGIDAIFSPDRIAEVIQALDADVIGLQEVGWHHRGEVGLDQFAYLEKKTGYTAHAGPTKNHRAAHYGNALLSRLPVLRSKPLDITMPHREPRGAIDADVKVGNRIVRIIVAHLGLDPWERNSQISRVLETVEDGPSRPTVFMGDLNEWRPNSPRLKRLLDRFPDCAAPRSFHARLPTLRLDRIFVSEELTLSGFEVIRTPLTRRASDHLPVRALIGLPVAL